MTAMVKALEVMVAEAEPWTADLLIQLVRDVRPDARILQVSDGETALAKCQHRLPDLVIADDDLPGIDGLELLRQLRDPPRTPALPFILLSGRLDARSVRAARPLAPSAYLAKPFNAEQLRQRLLGILGSSAAPLANASKPLLVDSLDDYLNAVREEGQGAPLLASVRDSVSQCLNGDDTNLRELEQAFARDPQITARLIAAANSAAHHQGTPCQTLNQALPRLGRARTLNLALGMAVQRNAQLDDPRLAELASSVWQTAQRSAELAHWLAIELHLDAELCFTAGQLHNIGELALLRSLQDWQDAGGMLRDEDIHQHFQTHAANFGSALHTHWRLPFGLRELTSAFYHLGSGVFSREALVLNLVCLLLQQRSNQSPKELSDERCVRLLRLDLGLLERIPGL